MQQKAKQELNKREGLASGRLSECLSETWPDPKSENQIAMLRNRRSIFQDMSGPMQERMHQGRKAPWHSRVFQKPSVVVPYDARGKWQHRTLWRSDDTGFRKGCASYQKCNSISQTRVKFVVYLLCRGHITYDNPSQQGPLATFLSLHGKLGALQKHEN